MDRVEQIARAVLYEGYILWPYRRSALKNRQRWTFGGVFPPAWSDLHPDDAAALEAQCLVEGPPDARISVAVRFLHVVERRVHDGERFVDELEVGGTRYLAWEEAREREVALPAATLDSLAEPLRAGFGFAAATEDEPLTGSAASIVRSSEVVDGNVDVGAKRVEPGVFRLSVRVANETPWAGNDRQAALRHAFVSTHLVLHVEGGEFVSLTDPPERLRAHAERCRNSGVWPILVGDDGDRSTLLCSPIILSDYPEIAPESPGDLFDGGEIDQLLVLNILGLTDAEKEEMRASDPRAREILDRCSGLSRDDLMRLHGTIRDFGPAAR